MSGINRRQVFGLLFALRAGDSICGLAVADLGAWEAESVLRGARCGDVPIWPERPLISVYAMPAPKKPRQFASRGGLVVVIVA